MRVAVMQPYFFPYVGYFQLIGAVDLFIVYDNIKYTKKGWINRNRMLMNGSDSVFSLPLKSASDSLHICDRELSAEFDAVKLLNQFTGAYRQAPCFEQTFPIIEDIVRYEEANLFRFLYHSITKTCEHLGVTTHIAIASQIAIDHTLRNQDKVLALCIAAGADTYVNAIGGMKLYSKDDFRKRGIDLKFIRSQPFEYPQFGGSFVPWLSIIDVLMFNPLETIRDCISKHYEMV